MLTVAALRLWWGNTKILYIPYFQIFAWESVKIIHHNLNSISFKLCALFDNECILGMLKKTKTKNLILWHVACAFPITHGHGESHRDIKVVCPAVIREGLVYCSMGYSTRLVQHILRLAGHDLFSIPSEGKA